MSATVDILNPDRPNRIVIVASNPGVSEQTGWPIGYWWAELSHPFLEFTGRGYNVDMSLPVMTATGQADARSPCGATR